MELLTDSGEDWTQQIEPLLDAYKLILQPAQQTTYSGMSSLIEMWELRDENLFLRGNIYMYSGEELSNEELLLQFKEEMKIDNALFFTDRNILLLQGDNYIYKMEERVRMDRILQRFVQWQSPEFQKFSTHYQEVKRLCQEFKTTVFQSLNSQFFAGEIAKSWRNYAVAYQQNIWEKASLSYIQQEFCMYFCCYVVFKGLDHASKFFSFLPNNLQSHSAELQEMCLEVVETSSKYVAYFIHLLPKINALLPSSDEKLRVCVNICRELLSEDRALLSPSEQYMEAKFLFSGLEHASRVVQGLSVPLHEYAYTPLGLGTDAIGVIFREKGSRRSYSQWVDHGFQPKDVRLSAVVLEYVELHMTSAHGKALQNFVRVRNLPTSNTKDLFSRTSNTSEDAYIPLFTASITVNSPILSLIKKEKVSGSKSQEGTVLKKMTQVVSTLLCTPQEEGSSSYALIKLPLDVWESSLFSDIRKTLSFSCSLVWEFVLPTTSLQKRTFIWILLIYKKESKPTHKALYYHRHVLTSFKDIRHQGDKFFSNKEKIQSKRLPFGKDWLDLSDQRGKWNELFYWIQREPQVFIQSILPKGGVPLSYTLFTPNEPATIEEECTTEYLERKLNTFQDSSGKLLHVHPKYPYLRLFTINEVFGGSSPDLGPCLVWIDHPPQAPFIWMLPDIMSATGFQHVRIFPLLKKGRSKEYNFSESVLKSFQFACLPDYLAALLQKITDVFPSRRVDSSNVREFFEAALAMYRDFMQYVKTPRTFFKELNRSQVPLKEVYHAIGLVRKSFEEFLQVVESQEYESWDQCFLNLETSILKLSFYNEVDLLHALFAQAYLQPELGPNSTLPNVHFGLDTRDWVRLGYELCALSESASHAPDTFALKIESIKHSEGCYYPHYDVERNRIHLSRNWCITDVCPPHGADVLRKRIQQLCSCLRQVVVQDLKRLEVNEVIWDSMKLYEVRLLPLVCERLGQGLRFERMVLEWIDAWKREQVDPQRKG